MRWLDAAGPWLIFAIIAWVVAGLFQSFFARRQALVHLQTLGCPHCGAPWTGHKVCSSCQRDIDPNKNHLVTRIVFSVGALATGPAIGIFVVHLLTGK